MVAAKDETPIEYDANSETYRFDNERAKEPVSVAVVRAVSAVVETPIADLDPLYEAINPDALNLLYEPRHDGALRRGGGKTSFTFNGCDVTVHAHGEVEVELLSSPEDDL